MGKICLKGKKILIGEELCEAVIEIENGKITSIKKGTSDCGSCQCQKIIDAGDLVVMAGIVDSHVHVNEPGRTEWEGYYTATRAAAAGGITTIVDMPLNSIPPTTTVDNFRVKRDSTDGKLWVDCGFWGGVVPSNKDELVPMIKQGVVGFKCFLIHSGVDEFPHVTKIQVDEALEKLKGSGSLLAFHAEVDVHTDNSSDPALYDTFLQSRPPQMEFQAIEMVVEMCRKHKDVRCHVVHLSNAEALTIIKKIKSEGFPLTIETCPHYLTLSAEEILPKRTEFKCCPPIRDSRNQEALWEGLRTGLIDMIVSDHSPCTADLKMPGDKDFMEAWGGISSVQFGLPNIWTHARKRGFNLVDISRWMSQNPSKLAGFENFKGKIEVGFDADFVIWDPEEEFVVEENMIEHKNKLSPYIGKVFQGKVYKTILRGEEIYNSGPDKEFNNCAFIGPFGKMILNRK